MERLLTRKVAAARELHVCHEAAHHQT